ncbi:helix-turn-helix domain-containing protein [Paracoccus sp. Z330]|uniref:Helix-turn-helix domain-containing protein n=1 Tax=Paracoccus onchidii TaxID=3017813 RepID=A0ABT4ZKG0_9RHOB|nr:helix-turn-helix domain-containing protein [Paracoccus onchidii]MDB6179483.1 helix-turn-helix domain-containing protein [Paracoccus onchidii]
MSHNATNWAIQQRGLKPTTKIVLWHLCDRHNPDYGCFPSQRLLAHDCEISRSTLNVHLDRLEKAGLIRRTNCFDPETKRQRPTRYFLGFEVPLAPAGSDPCPETGHGFDGTDALSNPAIETPSNAAGAARPCPDTGHGAVSGFRADPCPENGQSRVRNPDHNPVREPLREPVKEEECAQAREEVPEEFFGRLLEALGFDPDGALPSWWQGWPPREHVRRWRDDLGLSEEQILGVAEVSRSDHPTPPDGPKALDRAMERAAQSSAPSSAAKARHRRTAVAKPPGDDEVAEFYAGLVNADGYLPPSTINNRIRELLLARDLVTPERLRMRGVL